MISRVKELWEMTSNIPMFTNKWHGWLLTYISSKCFSGEVISRSRDKSNPYRIIYISTIAAICKKMKYDDFDHVIDSDYIFQPSHLQYIFSDYEMVAVHPMQNDFISNIDSDDIDVVILFNDYNSSDYYLSGMSNQ